MPYTSSIQARRRFFFLAATLMVALAGGWAGAQRMVGVDPPVKLYRAERGSTLTGTLTVLNPSDTSVRVVMSLSDWVYQEDGTPAYPEAGTTERSIAPWTTFSPSEAVLEPGARVQVRYTVAIPEAASAGTHWGVLFAKGQDVNPQPGVRLAAFNARVAHTIYVNVPPERPEGKVVGIFGQPPGEGAGDYALAIQYANTGNVAQQLVGHFELRDASGTSVFSRDLPQRVTLPGETTASLVRIHGPLEAGAYSALVVYNYGDPQTDVAGEYPFVLDDALPAPDANDGGSDSSAGTTGP